MLIPIMEEADPPQSKQSGAEKGALFGHWRKKKNTQNFQYGQNMKGSATLHCFEEAIAARAEAELT